MANILILESDEALRQSFSQILQGMSFAVRTARDVDEATSLLAEQPFEVVLAECPPDSNRELVLKVRALAPDAALLVITDKPDFILAVDSMRAGACDCLVKPISAEILGQAIRRALHLGSIFAGFQHLVAERTRELSESEAFYHSLVENLGQSALRKDCGGRFTFANRRFCESLGRTLDEVRGRTDADFFPADLAAKYAADDRRVIESGRLWETVEEHQLADGQRRFVHVVKAPVYDSAGLNIGLQCIFWDITARRESEEQLRKLARAVEQSPVSIVITNRAGDIEFVNPKFTELTGYTLAEAVGKNPRILKSGTLPQQVYTDLWATITAGREWKGEFHNRRKDGTCFWEAASISGVRDSSGAITHFIAVKEDISERKRLQTELASACDAALTSTRVKAEFLANMSHEIRTPMNGVIGLTNLLLDTSLSDEQRHFAETIRESAESLLTVINDILDFSKLEARKLVLESNDFDLRESMEGILELLAEKAQSKGLELTGFVAPQVPSKIRGDCGRLRQILFNLLGNAIKFTERGEVNLSVSCLRESPADILLRFEVRDTGIGIGPQTQSRLFQAFSQADGSTTRKYGGTGLGLAISKQLAERMEGEMGVESQPGQGSTFWFTARFEICPPGVASAAAKTSLEEVRILIVDDNATNRKILRHLTRFWKMQPTCASSAREALQLLRQAEADPFPLAILDMQMPEMDGLMLARAIQADPTLARTRLVMLTSLGQTLTSAELKEAGIEACQTKPVREALLFRCLAAVVGGTSTRIKPRPVRQSQTPRSRLRILLAEDNGINQKVALGQLKKLGCTAHLVANGRQVLEALDQASYDLVLMDCQMPEIDGYEATRQIRRRERHQGIQPIWIIAMTARAMESDRAECLAAGMNDYLSKPVSQSDLERVLLCCPPRQAGSTARPLGDPATSILPPTEGPLWTTPPAPLVDFDRLKEATGGDPETEREIVQLYVSQAEEILQGLNAAVRDGSATQINQLAHKLCGASSACGIEAMVKPLQQLEQQGRENRLAGMSELVTDIKARFTQVIQCLEEQTPTVPSGPLAPLNRLNQCSKSIEGVN